MAFINVNKINLEDTSDGVEAFTNTTLLLASLTFDSVKENNIETVLFHLRGLMVSADTLAHFLKEKLNDQNK